MSTSAEQFAAAQFRVSAEIEDPRSGAVSTISDVVSVSATFSLNTIPTASLIVAVGRSTQDIERIATIHKIRNELKPRAKVSVYLDVIPADIGDPSKIKKGRYKIFDGFLAGIGYQRSHNNANYVLNLVHWLDDLNNSTTVNGDWLPGAPTNYAAAALSIAANSGFVTALTNIPEIAYPDAAERSRNDLWGELIKPIFQEIAGLTSRDGLLEAGVGNAAAVAALARMPGKAEEKNYYKKLMFRLPGGAEQQATKALNDYFTKVANDPAEQNSFWAKLVTEIAADFMFAISPAVDWALPIPFCAGLQWRDGGKVINATEYNYANLSSNMSQLIEAVHVVYPTGSWANVAPENPLPGGTNAPLSYFRPYTSWPPPQAIGKFEELRGLKLFKQPPRWLTSIDAAAFAALTTALESTLGFDPQDPKQDLPTNIIKTQQACANLQNICLYFARHWYCTEVLQQRVGELSGPLRFDIAPGSVVKIITPIVDREQGTDDFVIASVMSVSYVINSERATAGTSFTIAHTKSPVEAVATYYSEPTPPLYNEAFYDAPLAEPIP